MKNLYLFTLLLVGLVFQSQLSVASWETGGANVSGASDKTTHNYITSVISLNGTLPVGHVPILIAATDNIQKTSGPTNQCSSVSDTQGNLWVKLAEYTNGAGGMGKGATVCIFYSILSAQLTELTDWVTLNLSTPITAKALTIFDLVIPPGHAVSISGSSVDQDWTATDVGSATISGLQNSEHLFLRAIANETQTNWIATPSSGYSLTGSNQTQGQGDSSNMGVCGEYRILTATGDSSDPTMLNLRSDKATIYIALEEN